MSIRITLLCVGLWLSFGGYFAGCRNRESSDLKDSSQTRERLKKEQLPPSDNPNREEGFDRHPDRLILTKHARCRMGCRHIDESEIREILAKGRVNQRKSEPAGRPDPKYALEGTTRDGQEVRIIIAASPRGMVIVTVIDLENEWKCDCR